MKPINRDISLTRMDLQLCWVFFKFVLSLLRTTVAFWDSSDQMDSPGPAPGVQIRLCDKGHHSLIRPYYHKILESFTMFIVFMFYLKLDQPNKVGCRNQNPQLVVYFASNSPAPSSNGPTPPQHCSTVQGAYLRANGRMRVLLTRITRTPPFVQGEAALSWL